MNFEGVQEKPMRAALAWAQRGMRRGQTPFGACVVRQGQVISVAHNRVWKNLDITAHAEIVAIRAACKKLRTVDLSGCVIYSTCEPCPMCFSACHWARITTVVYGADIKDAQKAGFHEMPVSNRFLARRGKSQVQVVGGFLREEARSLFAEWGRQAGRRVY